MNVDAGEEAVAAVIETRGGPFVFQKISIGPLAHDEVLVRVEGVGICHTDIAARDQMLPVPLPAILGHEAAGKVVATGPNVVKVKQGDPVVLTFRSCGKCRQCLADAPSYCDRFVALNYTGCQDDGTPRFLNGTEAVSGDFFGQSSFATLAIAHERNVVKVESTLPLALLGPLACGVQSGAGAVLRALSCEVGSSIAIYGSGTVGLSAVMAARAAGCEKIIVSDPVTSRRQLALELGATHVLDPSGGNVSKLVRQIAVNGVDYAIDTSGVAVVMNDAIRSLRPRGTLGLLGIPERADLPTPGLAASVLTFGIKIIGIIEGDSNPDTFIPELLALHAAGKFPFERLITTYKFEDINKAVEDQRKGVVIKPVLLMSDTTKNSVVS